MAKQPNFDAAKRQLDAALNRLDTADTQPDPLPAWDEPQRPAWVAVPEAPAPAPLPVQASEALTRLLIGAVVLGLDGLGAQAGRWERAAGLERGIPTPNQAGLDIPVRAPGDPRFRHGLIGWVFETEEELRPQGNPLQWLRGVAGHFSGSVFSAVLDGLPRFVPNMQRAESGEQDTARWVARGQLEEQRSRAFASAAIDDMLNQAIPYLASQRGVQQAVSALVRSPAMDDAIVVLARREGVRQAVAELVRSPVMEDAVTTLVRSPAMEDAVTYLVGTKAMDEAISTLAHSPALVELVHTQSSSIADAVVEEVRERAVSADIFAERLARRLLRRPPRAKLPPEAHGLFVSRSRQR